MGNKNTTTQPTVDPTTIKIPIKTDTVASFFDVTAFYIDNYSINDLFRNIMDKIHQESFPKKYIVRKVCCSFIGSDEETQIIDCKTFNQNEQIINKSIICYDKTEIIRKGMTILTELCYQHKVNLNDINCPHMIKEKTSNPLQCPIYNAMKTQYEWNEDNLAHLNQYNHFKDEYAEKLDCKYLDQCNSYKRLEIGSYSINDQCHMKLYKHPPRKRWIALQENMHSLVLNKKRTQNYNLYKPTVYDIDSCDPKEGYLHQLIKEVIWNGNKSDLCLTDDDLKNDNYSILDIVDDKLSSYRHKAIGSPLNRAEMLALILYTGCDCNYDLCTSQRNGNYAKWKWFDYCLYFAIYGLSKHEIGFFKVYSGLNKVKLDCNNVKNGYFVTYVSTSWSKEVSLSFMENEGMIIEIDKEFKSLRKVRCCDVSWISKFPDECEILFARHKGGKNSSGFNSFKLKVIDQQSGIQTISLYK